MRYAGFFALAIVAGALGVTSAPVSAQSRQSTEIPAEFPPASYTGRQYVDSRGCVYVRAGIDGNVNWVPRVNRARDHLCGARPTATAAAPAPTPRRAENVVQITPDPEPAAAPAPQVRAAAPAPRPQPAPRATARRAPVAAAVPKPVVRRVETPTPQRVVRAAPKPAPRIVAPKPAAPPQAVQQAARQACRGASPISAQYIHDGSRYKVRCGPQSTPHVTLVRRGEAPTPDKNVHRLQYGDSGTRVSGNTRIVPRHVYENRDDQVVRTPKGYRPAFDDDRLNRKRANQTVEGYLKTQLVWTNTVPRRLVDRRTGRDVTAKYPKLIYPYTDYATQKAHTSTKGAAKAAEPRMASRSVPNKPAAVAKGRYVQVGTFGVPANAERTARRLQGMGLPVRYGKYSKGGKSYRIVMAGPFSSQSDLSRALSAARRAGFGDAFVR
ncbi:SPOR domain-containing protein [Thalassococcus sp. BH17M4-6]|uniref:SPOR domain-containing protein n=1 Tax=Thalassococcus sp. BH17M4-6 TaxID=3413148 RepID=UPI003BCAE2CE